MNDLNELLRIIEGIVRHYPERRYLTPLSQRLVDSLESLKDIIESTPEILEASQSELREILLDCVRPPKQMVGDNFENEFPVRSLEIWLEKNPEFLRLK